MKKLNKVKYIIVIYCILLSCSDDVTIDKKLIVDNSKLEIEVILNSLEYHEFEKGTSTFLKGKIFVNNKSSDSIVFNLEQVKLLCKGKTSNIYINSVASVLIQDVDLASDSTYTKDVYWAFDGRLEVESVDKMNLVYKRIDQPVGRQSN